jgi:hypothetical protein
MVSKHQPQVRKNSTTTLRKTPVRPDTYTLKPDAVGHVGTAAESEKATINISKEAIENLKSKVKRPDRSTE